jgi:uncharacterized protein YjbI with pentapeptide repeats
MLVLKKIVIIVAILVISSGAVNAQYSPLDEEKFQVTNVCAGCNLNDVIIYDDHQNGNLIKANLSGAILLGDFSGTDFSNIDGIHMSASINLAQTNFSRAVLIGADLGFANLTYSNFREANIRGVNFFGANLYGAIISPEQLLSAKTVCGAILPDGSQGQCSLTYVHNFLGGLLSERPSGFYFLVN